MQHHNTEAFGGSELPIASLGRATKRTADVSSQTAQPDTLVLMASSHPQARTLVELAARRARVECRHHAKSRARGAAAKKAKSKSPKATIAKDGEIFITAASEAMASGPATEVYVFARSTRGCPKRMPPNSKAHRTQGQAML